MDTRFKEFIFYTRFWRFMEIYLAITYKSSNFYNNSNR